MWVVDIEMQFAPAASAVQQPRKHIFVYFLGLPPLVALAGTLHHFPRLAVNDRLVNILENELVFLGVLKPPLVLKGLGKGLEVYHIAHILPGVENFVDGGLTPIVWAVLVCAALFPTSANTLAPPILGRG